MSVDIDVDTLLDATLKDPNALEKVAAKALETKESTQQEEERHRSERKRSRDRDDRDRDDRKHRRSRSPRRDRSRDDRRDRDRDRHRRSRSRSPRRSSRRSRSRSRDKERDKERDILRERRRRDEDRERQRQREMLLSPAERAAIEAERDARTVFAFNLPIRADEREIVRYFSKAGEVRDVRLITDRNSRKPKGFGYIEFADKTSIKAGISLSGTQFMGQTIQVQQTHAEKNRNASSSITVTAGPDRGLTRLYVGSLHLNVTEDDLRKLFNQYGEIDAITIHADAETGRSRGFGFVQFRKSEDARRAMVNVNGQDVAGRPIKVGFESGREKEGGGTLPSGRDLDDDDQGLRLNSASRAQLMAKLQRPSDVAPPPPPPAPAGPPPPIEPEPTHCVLIKNMFDPASESEPNWDQEIKQDVSEECSKFGSIVHVYVDKDSQGFVYMKFGSIPGAQNAINALNGRWFAGRMIEVDFVPEYIYHNRFPESRI